MCCPAALTTFAAGPVRHQPKRSPPKRKKARREAGLEVWRLERGEVQSGTQVLGKAQERRSADQGVRTARAAKAAAVVRIVFMSVPCDQNSVGVRINPRLFRPDVGFVSCVSCAGDSVSRAALRTCSSLK